MYRFKDYLLMLPGPTNVPPRVLRAMLKPMINHRGREFEEFFDRLQRKLQYLFQTRGFIALLSSSGTGGVDFAVSNAISENDKVLIFDTGFFASVRAAKTVKAYGGKPIVAKLEMGSGPTVEKAKEYFDEFKDLRAVLIVYNETSTGVLTSSLPEVCVEASKRGLTTIVDAVSAVGGVELRVDEWRIDFCVGASQKCIAAPPGVAFVSVSERMVEEAFKKPSRTEYLDLKEYLVYAERRQTPFTPNLPVFYALEEALNMVEEETLEKRILRHRLCSEALYRGFKSLGFTVFPKPEFKSPTVVVVKPPGEVSIDRLRRILKERYGVLVAPGIGEYRDILVRVGCMGVVSAREVLYTLHAFESSLLELGLKVERGIAVSEASKILSGLP